MAYIFTPHVRQRMRQRRVTQEQVEETINSPEVKYRDKYTEGRIVHLRTFGRRTLKVVFHPQGNDAHIITVYWLEPGGNS